jgi:outer membrane protein TolC
MGERIEYSENRQWTNYITTDPIKLIQNIFGGGDVQRGRIEIANLEIQTADLEAAKALLERQQEETKTFLSNEVLRLVLAYEAASRQETLIQHQLTTYQQQQHIYQISYRLGHSNTSEYMATQIRGEQLQSNIVELETKKSQTIRELLQLTGF